MLVGRIDQRAAACACHRHCDFRRAKCRFGEKRQPTTSKTRRAHPVSGAGELAGLAQVKWQSEAAGRRHEGVA